MGKPLVRPALTTALRRSCKARDLGPGSSVITLRSVPSDDWIDETMMLLCSVGRLTPDDSSVVPDHHFVTKTKKRVTRVTRFFAAEEVGFEPTVPIDTAVSRLPDSAALAPLRQRVYNARLDRLLVVTVAQGLGWCVTRPRTVRMKERGTAWPNQHSTTRSCGKRSTPPTRPPSTTTYRSGACS